MAIALDSLLAQARLQRVTPGSVAAWGDDDGDHVAWAGRLDYDEDAEPVTADTIYDLASLTKALATTTLAMQLVSRGELDLGAAVAEVLPGAARSLTFSDLLGHSSGLPAHVELFRAMGVPSYDRDVRAELLQRALSVPVDTAPGVRCVYSDIGFIVLGFAIEVLTGDRLDRMFRDRVAAPLGLRDLSYVDSSAGGQHPEPHRVAPTEEDPWRGRLVHGQVHDENAFAGGGICGHAGLFGSAPAVAALARALLRTWSGDDGGLAIDPAVCRRFWELPAVPGSSWRLGWDTPSPAPGRSHAGDAWPREHSIGHLAFTGCSLWLHRPQRRYAILLSNRVHPRRDGTGILELRRGAMDLMAGALLDPARR